MKRINHSYLYFFILAALSLPQFAIAQTAPVITFPPSTFPTVVGPSAPPASTAAVTPTNAEVPKQTFNAPVIQTAGPKPSVPDVQAVHASLSTQSPPLINFPLNPLPKVVGPSLPSVNYYRPTSAGAANEADKILSAEDLKKAGLKISIDGMNVQLNGSIPLACAANLTMDVSRKDPEDSDGDENDELTSIDDLNKQSSIIGVRVTFKGNDSVKGKSSTLADCMRNESDSNVDVSSLDALKKSILLSDNEFARVGFEDNNGHVGDKFLTSKSYDKIAKVLKFKDCSDCKVDPKKIQAAMDELNGQPAAADSLRSALMEKAISDIESKIEKADSIGKIEGIRNDLVSYSSELAKLKSDDGIDKDKLQDGLEAAFRKLQAKTGDLAYSDQKHAPKYADEIVKNAKVISADSSLSKDLKDEQTNVAKAYAKDGVMRLNFISAINPDDGEVRDYLENAQVKIHNAQLQVNANCQSTMFNQNRINSNACQQSIATMQGLESTAEQLATKYMAAQQHPNDPLPTLNNSLAMNGTTMLNGMQVSGAVKGYFPNGNGAFTPVTSQTNGQVAQNNVFGMPSYIAPYAGMYTPGSNSAFSVTAPNYTSTNVQYQLTSPTVQQSSLVPQIPLQKTNSNLNTNMLPSTPPLGIFAPEYGFNS